MAGHEARQLLVRLFRGERADGVDEEAAGLHGLRHRSEESRLQLRQAIDKVAPTNSRILITGPSGCGKELAARVMHAKSARADGPFVALNAAAMVPGRGPRRYLCGGKAVPIPELAAILNDITGCRFAAAPVPGRVMRAVGSAADGLTAVVPFHTPITHEAMVVLTQLPPTDDRAAVDELGVHFRAPRDTLADTIASLCEAGRLPRRMCTRF